MTNEDLLIEFEDLIRSMPDKWSLAQQDDPQFEWLARASALVQLSSGFVPLDSLELDRLISNLYGHSAVTVDAAISRIVILIKRIRYSLLVQTRGVQVAVHAQGSVFDYFDSIRKVVELATQDVFFVDPYMEAEFVARYLPHVKSGATIRLLTHEKLGSLIPAAKLFAQQSSAQIEIRSLKGLHDRFVFIDKKECHLSGASFKDGAKNAPAIVAQIVDGAGDLMQTYEGLWLKGAPVPLS